MDIREKNVFILGAIAFFMLLSSCDKEDPPCAAGSYDVYLNILQRIKFVKAMTPEEDWDEQSEWGVADIEKKQVELIAMSRNFRSPVVDKEGKAIRQVFEKTEARFYGNADWLELYMDSRRVGGGVESPEDSYFVLKIDNGLWFKITASHHWGKCETIMLKSFVFEGKRYAQYADGGHVEYIPIDEKKKREELKQAFPDGFPYKL